MLTIGGIPAAFTCDRASRRDFLRIGSLGMCGLSLPWLLATKAAAAPARSLVRDKSVVLLFLCGGPSHLETFSPNMDAPAPRCSLTGETSTAIPGVTFGATYTTLAALAKRLAIVRSYSPHQIADHAMAIKHVLTGGNPLQSDASLGSVAARLMKGSDAEGGMPPYAALIEEESDSQYREDEQRMRIGSACGSLGAACAPLTPGVDGQLTRDMRLNLPLGRIEDRRKLAQSLDSLARKIDRSGELSSVDRFGEQALDVVLGGATRKALDLTQENPEVLARYDTSHHKTGWLTQRTSTIGRQMLMARRLCQAGCRFVTVGYAGWDNHGNDKHPGVVEGMHLLGTPLDHAVSAFLEDVRQLGMEDDVLLVITGEFGRTPRIQANGGRDHWPGLCPLVFAGGGLSMGQVIGRMARTGDIPASDPYRLDHLVGTILHTLFDVGQARLADGIPSELVRLLERSEPIGGLM